MAESQVSGFNQGCERMISGKKDGKGETITQERGNMNKVVLRCITNKNKWAFNWQIPNLRIL